MSDSQPSQLAAFFKKSGQPAHRGKFLSRVFGIFNEELVRLWAADERCRYRDIGRPTVFNASDGKGFTLDFLFEDRVTHKHFIVEMKCEIEFQGYRFMTLRDPKQLDHHKKPAFDLFRSLARDPQSCRVQVHREPIEVDGAILIWVDVKENGRSAIISTFGFHDVVGMNRIVEDLWIWRPEPFVSFIQSLSNWSDELFGFIDGKEHQMIRPFKHDDKGYISWRDCHPNGFICNIPYSRGEQSWKPICIHKASCHVLASNKNDEQPWTTKGYFKICAEEMQTIQDWIRTNVEVPTGLQLKKCSKCAP